MAEAWLTIIGFGEDGPEGLSPASRAALDSAEIVMAPARHLKALGETPATQIDWPVPFADGLPVLRDLQGRRVVVLASGDPFWFGAGSVIARSFDPSEWRAFPGPSVFSLAASHLGWPLETTRCLGLHAAPVQRLRPYLAAGGRVIVTLRDGDAMGELARWLTTIGFGDTTCHVMEALGGPRERVRIAVAQTFDLADVAHPVAVALDLAGDGSALTRASGQSDDVFNTDGQITKRPIRALTLSALAPKPGERLWDIGAGSGSVALEWLLTDPTTRATAIEHRADRADRIRSNALTLGQDRLEVVTGAAPQALTGLAAPDAIFVGGGLSRALLDWLTQQSNPGTRLVANAVTLDTEAILTEAQARMGGTLLKLALSEAAPLGRFRGWKAAYPVVQWSVTL